MNAFDSKLLDGKTKLHFVGIGGSGMFPLVQILHEVGYEITGSDVNEGDIIDRERKLGIPISMGHKAENVHGAELVVYTAAIMRGNPEIEEAHRLGIPTVERSILLGYVANTYPHPICIAGTHGKTTTTAMTTQIMVMAHADPAAVIGGKLPLIDAYGRYGTGREIVVEACEYSNTFLHLVPYISVLLNVDADHLEFFKTMENLEESFRKFALLTTHTVIANLDDANTVKVIHNLDRHIRTIGIDTPADYRAVHVREYRPSFFCFDVQVLGVPAVHIELSVPGRHNVYNALAAFACATMSGCTADECARGINAFRGAGRRFEFLGEVNGVTIADDYAHHPTELEATLRAAKEMDYKRVWAVFQPFTYTRTQMLLDDFARVLQIADKVVMTEIMGSRERAEDYAVRTKDLAAKVMDFNRVWAVFQPFTYSRTKMLMNDFARVLPIADHVVMSEIMGSREVNTYGVYTKDLADKIPGSVWYDTFDEVVDHVMKNARPGDLVITLGCGDIYKAAKKMVAWEA